MDADIEDALDTGGRDRPLYRQVQDRLQAALADGVWKPGEMLPTESDLGQRFQVSTGTVRQAVLALVREGLLTRRAGKGTFVARIDPSQGFDRFFRFRRDAPAADFHPQIKVLDVNTLCRAEPSILETLALAPGDEVLSIKRLQLQDETPVCFSISYFSRAMVPLLESENLSERLYPILEERFGLHVVRADELLRAVAADEEVGRLLQIDEKSPVILIERTVYTYRDRVLECRKTYGRSDKFSYKIQLR